MGYPIRFFDSMNEQELRNALTSLPLGGFRYFKSIGSTNDEALAWAAQGASDLSLVVTDEQTAGRGRSGRKWFTPPESALAFSLVLRPTAAEQSYPARTTGLGALALADVLRARNLQAQIKWPNDVLIKGKKVAGILVESIWMGDKLDASVLGMGVNVFSASVPPADETLFPATSIETELGYPVGRAELFSDLLAALLSWRSRIGSNDFIQAWEEALAFRGKQIKLARDNEPPRIGELLGLEPDGSLRFRNESGEIHQVKFGEIHLRPA